MYPTPTSIIQKPMTILTNEIVRTLSVFDRNRCLPVPMDIPAKINIMIVSNPYHCHHMTRTSNPSFFHINMSEGLTGMLKAKRPSAHANGPSTHRTVNVFVTLRPFGVTRRSVSCVPFRCGEKLRIVEVVFTSFSARTVVPRISVSVP